MSIPTDDFMMLFIISIVKPGLDWLHEGHLPNQASLRPASSKVPPSRQEQGNPPDPPNPRIIPLRFLRPTTLPRALHHDLDSLFKYHSHAVQSEELSLTRRVLPISTQCTPDSKRVNES